MFIIYFTDLSTKNKNIKDGGSYVYKYKKYRRLEKEKKSVVSFEKFLIFSTWVFSESAQYFI